MSYLQTRPELLARFRDGDPEALTEVYRVYQPILQDLAENAFRIRNPAEVADLVQDTMILAFERKRRLAYSGTKKYASYIGVILRNLFISRRRRGWREVLRRRFMNEDEDKLEKEVQQAADAEPEQDWQDPEALEIARDFAAALTGPERDVHQARYVDMLSSRAAAEKLNISHKKVRMLEDHFREELFKRLKRAGVR